MTSGIIEILLDSSEVKTLVGQDGNKWKIYPFVAPQGVEQPYIVVSKTGNNTQSMGKDCNSLLDYPVYDILCYSKNFRTTELLSEACRIALDGMASVTEVCEFLRIWLVTDRDAFSNDAQMYVHVSTYNAEQVRPIYT